MGRFFKFAMIALGLYLGWQHFSADRAPKVAPGQYAEIEIYTTRRCPYCREAKAYMDARGIAYLEKDVEGDMELRKEFRARGGYGVPYFFVHGKPMRGFDASRFEQLRAEGS
jgi:glutaredoxin